MTQDLQYLLVILTGVKPASIPSVRLHWCRLPLGMVVSELRDAGNISRAAAQQYQSPNIHLSRCIELSERGRMYGAGLLGDMQKIIVKSQQFSGGLLTVSNLHDDDRAIILPALPKSEERLI